MDRICLIEDDPTISELVADKLTREGFQVETFASVEPLMEKKELPPYDLYVVDVMLEGEATGLDLCQHLRRLSPSLPVLILSALSEPADRIEGLKSGADDYLTKPFETEELILRIKGMLKRRSWYGKLPSNHSVFEWGDSTVDFLRYQGTRGNRTFALTQKECMLLKLLVEKKGQVISRDEVLDRVWGYDSFPSTRTVDNFILRLRKHFEKEPGRPKHILSVRGMGYRFEPGETRA